MNKKKNNIEIDKETFNITMDLNVQGDDIKVYIPPVNKIEIKSNALILGKFLNVFQTENMATLLVDYDVYIDDIIEELANNKYRDDDLRNKYINDCKNKLESMLQRSLVSGYYLDKDNELKSLDVLNEDKKNIIKAQLLFFIVFSRYLSLDMSKEEYQSCLSRINISLTSLTSTEWKNTCMTQSLNKETSD